MLWEKKKYKAQIKGGCGEVITEPLYGLIQQLVVSPQRDDTVWSMKIFDRDGDPIYQIRDHAGTLIDRDGIPVGKDQQERLKFSFNELTANEDMDIVLNIMEKK